MANFRRESSNAWAEVWQTPLERRYQADYDRYDEAGATVHVGTK